MFFVSRSFVSWYYSGKEVMVMLNPMAFANAATVITVLFYLVIVISTYIAPDFVFAIGKSWLHSLNLESLKAKRIIPLDKAVLGLVSMSVLTWITTYAMIWLYNMWA